MLAHLDELRAAGVDSIKIEGRNKKAFYVASVVNAYRQVLDGAPAATFADELESVSHRPYGTGFYFGEAEQAPDYDGYEQQAMHVADVVEASGEELVARCRNRFAEGDELEVLAPREPVRRVVVRNLVWLPDPTEETPDPEPVPVPVANRSCGIYRFRAQTTDGEGLVASAGDFLRVRKFRRSARH